MFMVDIAVPRDIEESVAELNDVYLYTVDDLQNVVQENMKTRQAAAQQAREIVDAEVKRYQMAQRTLDAVPTIQDLRQNMEQIRDQVLAHSLRQVGAGKPAEEVLQQLATQLTNKLMHGPTAALHHVQEADRDQVVRLLERVYQIRARE